jgi:hypothetical protein
MPIAAPASAGALCDIAVFGDRDRLVSAIAIE